MITNLQEGARTRGTSGEAKSGAGWAYKQVGGVDPVGPAHVISSSQRDEATACLATASSPTARPFNMLAAPFAPGYSTGDYEALASIGSSFLRFYVQSNCSDLSCRALTSVVTPANRLPTNNNSTDVYAGLGF